MTDEWLTDPKGLVWGVKRNVGLTMRFPGVGEPEGKSTKLVEPLPANIYVIRQGQKVRLVSE